MRDNVERDLGSHLENALRGVIIADRYPKSALDITVMVLEGEEDCLWNEEHGQEHGVGGVGLMNVLAGCINVAVAALVDAKIDCLDLLSSGVASRTADSETDLLDPCPSEHESLACACVVGYLPARDEVVEVWSKAVSGQGTEQSTEALVDAAIKAARGSHKILKQVIKESLEQGNKPKKVGDQKVMNDVEMKT